MLAMPHVAKLRAPSRTPAAPSTARRARLVVAKASAARGDVGDIAAPAVSRRGVMGGTAGLAGAAALAGGAGVPGAVLAEEAAVVEAATGLVPPAQLFSGCKMVSVPSTVIKGCWQLSGGHKGEKESDRTAGSAALEDFQTFVDAGIYAFDTGPEACGYGNSEKIIGDYLRRAGSAAEGVQVNTKFCCVGAEMRNMTRDYVTANVDRPLARLGVSKIDNLQFYWNSYGAPDYVKTTQYLAEEQAKGKIVDIGLTNFDVPRIQDMLDGGVTIASNQIQYSLLDRRPDNAMAEFCKANGIALLPYGVVAGGFLSDRYLGLDASQIKLDTYSKQKYSSVIRKAGGWAWFQELLGALDGVAKKHGVTISDVATRWVLDKEVVPAVIIGARNASHVPDHLRIATFALDGADMGAINEVLDKGTKPQGDCYEWERGGVW